MNLTHQAYRNRMKMAWMAGVLVALALAMAVWSNVDTALTDADTLVLRAAFGPRSELHGARSFDEEVRLIHFVADSIVAMVPGLSGIPAFQDREPTDLFRRRSGLCFDRSRTIEKALEYYGFKTRHVFLLYKEDRSFLRTLLTRHSPSHAASEVMTRHGWLLVDSTSPWLALTKAGRPLAAKQLRQNAAMIDTLPALFRNDYWSLPGLYSRNGFFYRPFLPFPDVNWSDLISAVVGE